MNKSQFQKMIQESKPMASEYDVTEGYVGFYPYQNIQDGSVKMSIIKVMQMQHSGKHHNVVFSFDGEDFEMWCGDAFLESGVDSVSAQERVKNAIDTTGLFNDTILTNDILTNCYQSCEDSTGCHFHKTKGDIKNCKHTKHVLFLADESLISDLETMWFQFDEFATDGLMGHLLPRSMLEHYAFKKHLLLEGAKGSGKTWLAWDFADNVVKELNGATFFVAGHSQLDTLDLLGCDYIKGDNCIWVDGPLSAAFRSASKGVKTILLIDEFLRIPSRERSILIGALTPDNKGNYVLNTKNVIGIEDGVGQVEVLTVGADNLMIVATTNAGANYNVEELGSALSDRLVRVVCDENPELLFKILSGIANERGFNNKIVNKLCSFYNLVNDLVVQGQLHAKANTRHMKELLSYTCSAETLRQEVQRRALCWVGTTFDGKPSEKELGALLSAYDSVFA